MSPARRKALDKLLLLKKRAEDRSSAPAEIEAAHRAVKNIKRAHGITDKEIRAYARSRPTERNVTIERTGWSHPLSFRCGEVFRCFVVFAGEGEVSFVGQRKDSYKAERLLRLMLQEMNILLKQFRSICDADPELTARAVALGWTTLEKDYSLGVMDAVFPRLHEEKTRRRAADEPAPPERKPWERQPLVVVEDTATEAEQVHEVLDFLKRAYAPNIAADESLSEQEREAAREEEVLEQKGRVDHNDLYGMGHATGLWFDPVKILNLVDIDDA